MRLIFIQPAVGRKGGGAVYPKTWIMEPLWAATIAALLPKDCERLLMDDRLGEVDCLADADAVFISTECYTAKRSYEIADRFRARGGQAGRRKTEEGQDRIFHNTSMLIGR